MDKYSVPRPRRESFIKHQKDVNRQIYFPVIIASIVGVGMAVLSGYAAILNNPGVSMWADISLIWLIIPMMLGALIFLAASIALAYGLKKLLKISPYYTGRVQDFVFWLTTEIKIWTDKIISPVLTLKTWIDLISKHEE